MYLNYKKNVSTFLVLNENFNLYIFFFFGNVHIQENNEASF